MFIPLEIYQHDAEAVGDREGPRLESDATSVALINQEFQHSLQAIRYGVNTEGHYVLTTWSQAAQTSNSSSSVH